MAKMESTLKNMVLSLTLISLGASAALGFVYEMTKDPIAAALLNKKIEER
jgi:electron transport complex protein RnfG